MTILYQKKVIYYESPISEEARVQITGTFSFQLGRGKGWPSDTALNSLCNWRRRVRIRRGG